MNTNMIARRLYLPLFYANRMLLAILILPICFMMLLYVVYVLLLMLLVVLVLLLV